MAPLSDDLTRQTVEEIRSLACDAEAEAAEAAAARARARAIRLRRQAERSQSATADEPKQRRLAKLPRLRSFAAVLAVFVALFAVGASVEISVLHWNATRERQQVAEFSAAARQGVVTLTSLDYEHASEGVQRILEVSTGTFKDEFAKTANDFIQTVQESKVVSHGSVQATAVELGTMTENSAIVLVTSTSEITNAAGMKEDSRKYRIIVTVAREGGLLKMSKVEFMP